MPLLAPVTRAMRSFGVCMENFSDTWVAWCFRWTCGPRLHCVGIDPAIVFGEQRSDHRADVVGQTDTPQRGHVGNTLVNFGIVPDHSTTEIGGYRTRCDDIDSYL